MPSKKRATKGARALRPAPVVSTGPTIGCAIISGEGRLEELRPLLEQLSQLDQVIVVDTSPTSDVGLKKILNRKPFEYHHREWRGNPAGIHGVNDWGFGWAREESFKLLKTDYGLWLDTDDLIGAVVNDRVAVATPGFVRNALQMIVTDNPDAGLFFMDYQYDHDDHGNVAVVHARERLLKLDCEFHWMYPIHECVAPSVPVQAMGIKEIKIIHRSQQSNIRRNAEYLKEWYDQLREMDPVQNYEYLDRCRFQIGISLRAEQRLRESIEWFEGEFLAKHPNTNPLYAYTAFLMICEMALDLDDLEKAEEAALRAIAVKPNLAEGHIYLAQVKLMQGDDPQEILTLLQYTSMSEETPLEVIRKPSDQTFLPYCIVSECKYQLGDYQAALEFAEKALSIIPDNQNAMALYNRASLKVKERAAKEATLALFGVLESYEENVKAARLYTQLPYIIQDDADVRAAALRAKERIKHIEGEKADEEYVKLYTEGNRYAPIPEEEFLSGAIPGRERFEYILKRLRQNPEIKTVLDVGCSDAFHTLALAQLGYKVTGIDLDPKAVEIANERAKKLGVEGNFIQGFFERMDLEKEGLYKQFDAVICEEVLEHVQDPLLLLDSLADCAKDGAPVLLTTPDGSFGMGLMPEEDIDSKAVHVRSYTQESLEQLLFNPEYRITECHFLPADDRPNGWLVAEFKRQERPDGPKIRVYCGNGTVWNPDSIERGGVGGSETAVIHMARAWVALNCQVVVYCADTGIWDGAIYRNVDDWNPEHHSDVFISWRIPALFHAGRPNAVTTVLWTHDIHYNMDVTEELASRIDTIVALSEFHKDHLEKVHPNFQGKIWVSRNGIAASRYAGKNPARSKTRFFYSSSYDRGLLDLLEVWPRVREAVPDAELHVAYGVGVARQFAPPPIMAQIDRCLDLMSRLPGVFHYDALNQNDLADLQLTCEGWIYPVHPFEETYCISALEAQAAGCKIITRANGALPETIKHGLFIDSNDQIPNILAHLDEVWEPRWTEENRKWALSQTWNSLAKDWIRHLAPVEEKELITV